MKSRDQVANRVRSDLRIVGEPQNLRRTLRIAVVVGTILFLINQMDVVLDGRATAGTAFKIGLTYVVPFVVANLGMLGARRDAAST